VHATALRRLSVYAARPVSAAAHRVDLFDETSEPLSTVLRGRQRTVLGWVVAGTRDTQHLAALLHVKPGTDEGVEHRVDPFGRKSFPSSSIARRWISTSLSSSRIRRRARTSSLDSLVDAILSHPDIDSCCRDVKVVGGLGDRPP
jgi:hypothetical protein